MPLNTSEDPRAILVREKFFSLRPKALERWLWQQPLSPAAERVFWLHWEEGMRRGDWLSELSLRQVARECCMDASTVTRAYQALKECGLIRREDPGRDPYNPFQQAIAVTEVLLPRALVLQLRNIPSRGRRAKPETPVPVTTPPVAAAPVSKAPVMSRSESTALLRKLSDGERTEFFLASRDRSTTMSFSAQTRLAVDEQEKLIALLARLATDSATTVPPVTLQRASVAVGPRRVSALEAARLRREIGGQAGSSQVAELFRQVLWSVEEGALRRFETPLAINIAMKKIREGQWGRPHRMPPNWMRFAMPETCSVA